MNQAYCKLEIEDNRINKKDQIKDKGNSSKEESIFQEMKQKYYPVYKKKEHNKRVDYGKSKEEDIERINKMIQTPRLLDFWEIV